MISSLVGVLVLLTWATTSRDVLDWWGTFRYAHETTQVNAQIDFLLQAGQNLAFERGRTNVLLNAAGPASAENLDFLASRRQTIRQALEPLFQAGNLQDYPAARHLQAEYAGLLALRQEVDRAISLPAASRDPDLARRWLASLNALLEDVGDLVSTLSLVNDRYAVSFRNLSRLKVLAFELRNCLGMESSRLAALLSSGRALTLPELETLQKLRGQGDTLWKSLGREAAISNDPQVTAGIAEVNRAFYQDFRPLEDRVLQSLLAGQTPPVTVKDYTTASVPALDSIAGFMELLGRRTNDRVDRQFQASSLAFAWSIVMAAIALGAGILVLFVIIKRLFLPLAEIARQLEQLALGNLQASIVPVGYNDEITRGHSSVLAFRDSLIQRNELEEQLRRLSNSDSLTGLANRRCFDEALQKEWERAGRNGHLLTLVMLDVDLFKAYNDHLGHQAGDDCLRAVARVLAEHARRPGDLAARYGGEEFVVILPDLETGEGRLWAEQVRLAVADLALPHPASPLGVVSLSAGVAALQPSRDSQTTELIRLADTRLYQAKSGGRNRVVAE